MRSGEVPFTVHVPHMFSKCRIHLDFAVYNPQSTLILGLICQFRSVIQLLSSSERMGLKMMQIAWFVKDMGAFFVLLETIGLPQVRYFDVHVSVFEFSCINVCALLALQIFYDLYGLLFACFLLIPGLFDLLYISSLGHMPQVPHPTAGTTLLY